jgi:hypothetical protein
MFSEIETVLDPTNRSTANGEFFLLEMSAVKESKEI